MDVGCCPGIGAVLLEGGPRWVPALIDRGLSPNGHLARREIIAPCDQYSEQAEAFARSILDCEPLPYGVDDATASMRVLDAVFEREKPEAGLSYNRHLTSRAGNRPRGFSYYPAHGCAGTFRR